MTDTSMVDAIDQSYEPVAEVAQAPTVLPPPSTVVPFPKPAAPAAPAAAPTNEFSLAKPAAPAAPLNEFSIEAIRQNEEQRARAGVLSAQGKSPDAAAKALELSKKTGVPPDVIEADPVPAQERVALNEFSASSPAMKQWVGQDPYNARLTTDDQKSLARLDAAIRKMKAMTTESESADWEATVLPQPGGFLYGPMHKPAPTEFAKAEVQTGFEGAAASVVNAELIVSIRARQEISDIEAGKKPVAGPKSSYRMMTPEDRAQAALQLDAKIIRLAGQIKGSRQYQSELPQDPAVAPFNNALDAVNASHFTDTLLAALGNAGMVMAGGEPLPTPQNDAGAKQIRDVFSTFFRDPLAIIRSGTLSNIPMIGGAVAGGAVAGPVGAGLAGFSMDFLSRVEDVTKQAIEDFRDTGDTGIDTNDPEQVAAFLQRNPDFISNAALRAGLGSITIGVVDAVTKSINRPVRRARDLATVAPSNLIKSVGTEMAGEAAAEVAAGQDLSLKEVVQEGIGAVGISAGHTAAESIKELRQAGTEERVKAAAKEAGETITAANELLGDLQKRLAETGAVTLDDMVEKAGASKLATRSPEKLEDFIATLTGPENSVFVPAEAVQTLFQSMPAEEAKALSDALGITEQMAEAVASNGDVAIPLSKYITESTRSDIHKAWRDDVRMQADGFSKRQVEEDIKVRDARLKDFIARAEKQIEAGIAEVDPTTRVYEDMLAKLKTAGRFTDDAAKQQAALFAQRYATRAERSNGAFTDAWDAYSKAGPGTGLEVRSQLSERVGAYPPDRLDVLLDSIRSGKVAPSTTDAGAAEQFATDRTELATALQSMGVDLAQMTNAQVRAAIQAEVGKRAKGRTFEQATREAISAELAALAGGKVRGRAVPIGDVAPWLVDQARQAGIDISGYKHAIDVSALQHILTRHGDAKTELSRGQIAITQEDIQRIPDVLAHPDFVVFGAAGKRQQDVVGYIKTLEDGTVLYIEERRTGKKELAALSMRKYPAATNAETIASTLTSNVRNDGEGLKIVPAEGQSSVAGVEPGTYEQSQTQKELVAVHNLSARNLAHANKMGGIAAPSMAVIKGKNPFHGFGEISLIAPKTMIDPRADSTSKVFGSDVYSARYPQVSFKIKYSATKALQGRLAPLAKLANDDRFQIDADRLERDPIRELEQSPAVQAEFLIGRGLEPNYGENKHVSQRQMQQQIGAAGLTDEFNDHVERVLASLDPVERIFKGFTDRGARYIPHTIQNVLREMTRSIRDAEGFNYGVGSIRSKVTSQFRSIEALKKADHKIVSKEDFAKVKEEVNNEFVALANEAQTYNRQKGFGFMDTFSEHLKEIADGVSPARVLAEYYEGAPAELGVKMADFLNKLRNMPTEYFEAKIKRSVGLNEFAGAVVPDDASPRTLKLLADNGITDIKRYKTGDLDDRARAVREFQDTQFFQDARGQISFGPDRATITLFESRDLSTLLHEGGHLFLSELEFDAKGANASDQVKADWQAVLDWLGSKDGYITRDMHEQFARGFETYLMEGKAPSSELASAFRSFKNWLIQIYKRLSALEAPITPEIREVFDRMIATDEQIAAMRSAQGLNPIFTDAKSTGVTQAVFDAYTRQANAAADEAEQKLLQAKTEEIRKQRTKAWRADEKLVREEVREEVLVDESGQQALALLTTGEFPVGSTPEVLKGIKLTREDIVELYGDESVLALLPAGIYRDRASGPGAMSPDELAHVLGLDNGMELIERLMQIEAERRAMRAKGDRRSVAGARVDAETAERMKARHGDPLNDGTIEQEAQKAIHTDRQAMLMSSEMAVLARQAGHSGTISWANIKNWAAGAIGGKTVRDATRSSQYLRNERQAGKRVEQALAKGDFAEALKAKQDQLVNLALYQESVKAADDVDSAVRLMNRYAGAATLKGMDQDYLEQIHGLLEDFEFRTRTDRLLAERKSFEAWAEEQGAQGVEVVPPPRLARGLGLTNYRDMTVDELRGLHDTVRQVAHLGRTKRTLELDGRKRELDAVLTQMEETAARGVQRGKSLSVRGKSDIEISVGAARHWLRVANAELLKMERLLAFADGDKSGRGIFTRMIFRPIADAETRTNDRRTELGRQQKAIYEKVPAAQRKAWTRRHDIPELGTRLSKEEIIAVALNMGNAENLEKMLLGEKWTEDGVRAAVNRHLTKEEWRFVQDIWNLIDTQWLEFAAMARDTQGVAPPKVEAVPFMTPFGMTAGGYYPVAYDRRENLKAAKVGEKRDAALLVGMAPGATYGRPSTRAGASHARTAFNAPLELSLSVIGKHLDEVSHDIFHRRAVMDIYKIISNDRFREALRARLGVEYEAQFLPWLQRVASEARVNNATLVGLDKAARALRVNVTTMAMGVRVSTVVQQVAGYAASISSIGTKYMLKGMAEWVRHPFDVAKKVRASSGAMRNRANNLERDLKAAADKYRGKSTWKASVSRFAFRGIAMADAAVSIPTWIGGYHKGMAEGMSEEDAIYYADKVVRDTQGEGGAKDLSAFQASGSETWKLMSMFYSFLNVFYNAQQGLLEDAREPGKSFSQWADLFWQASLWMVISPIAAALLAGQGPGEDEDKFWWGMRSVGFGAFAGIPVIRDLASTMSRDMGGQPTGGFKLSPVEGPLEGSARLIKDLTKAFSGEDVGKNFIKNAFNVTGAFTGLPTGQPGVTTQFLWDVLVSGAESPQNMLEWLRGLTFGPDKK